jgi:uncharacterized protein (DUF2249 family)
MAKRTTIAMASKVGGCSVQDFFHKMAPLGFVVDTTVQAEELEIPSHKPLFVEEVDPANLIALDVRAQLETGKDPFDRIMQAVKQLKDHEVLKIINTFEPTPLIHLLGKKGFETYTEQMDDQLVHTYFRKSANTTVPQEAATPAQSSDWDGAMARFANQLTYLDVRQMDMPQPMHAILESLNKLGPEAALFVYHKRIPVFLLPELKERCLDYRTKELGEGEVHMLIFKP